MYKTHTFKEKMCKKIKLTNINDLGTDVENFEYSCNILVPTTEESVTKISVKSDRGRVETG